MSRPSLSTPCPAPYAFSNVPIPSAGRRLSTTSIASSQDDTADIDYTRAIDIELKNAKPRRKSTFKRKEQRGAPITIFEDVLEDEELAVEPRRPLAGSALLARPAQKPMHRAIPRHMQNQAEKQQPLQSIGQGRVRVSILSQDPVVQTALTDEALYESAAAKTSGHTEGRAFAGLKKEPRRRTIFVPSDDTTLLTIHPGAQTTGRLDDTFQLPQKHDQPTSPHRYNEPAPMPAIGKAFKRPRLSMALAPKRLPLSSVAAQDVSNLQGADVAGANGGKENMPPGGVATNVASLKEKTVATFKASPARSSLLRPTAASKARQSIVAREAVPLARSSGNHAKAPVSTRMQSLRPAVPQQWSRPQVTQHAAHPSTQHVQRSPPTTRKDRNASGMRSILNQQRPLERKVPRLPQYPVLSEDLAEPELYEDSWLSHQEIALTEVINQIFSDAKPGKEERHQPQTSLRERLLKIYHQQRVTTLHRRLQASLLYGALSRPRDTQGPPDPALDIGLRKRFLGLWLDSYDHSYLRAAAEVVFGHQLPKRASNTGHTEGSLDPHKGRRTLIGFLETFLVELEDVEEPVVERGDDSHPRWRKMILRSLMLVWLLDQASMARLTDGCLFKRTSARKSSLAVLQSLATMLIPSTGYITRVLGHLDYEVSCVQDPLDEVQYCIDNIAVDLRDGILLTRLVEILLFSRKQSFAANAATDATVTIRMPDLTILESALRSTDGLGCPRVLTRHLKMPCIGRAQKVFNLDIAISALRDHGRIGNEPDEVSAMDVVNGHRERTLSLLWSLVSVHGLDQLVAFEELIADIKRTSGAAMELPNDCINIPQSEQESLLKKWASAHCAGKGIRIGNLTTAFADGKAYAAILEDLTWYTSTGSYHSSISWASSGQLQQQLQAFGCSTAFISQLTVNAGTIPSRKTTISNLAFLASRLLPLARRWSAAMVIQRVFRDRRLKTVVSRRIASMRLAYGCATVVKTHQRMTEAVIVLQRAWRRVVDIRIERLNSDVSNFQSLAKGWMERRRLSWGRCEHPMRVVGGW